MYFPTICCSHTGFLTVLFCHEWVLNFVRCGSCMCGTGRILCLLCCAYVCRGRVVCSAVRAGCLLTDSLSGGPSLVGCGVSSVTALLFSLLAVLVFAWYTQVLRCGCARIYSRYVFLTDRPFIVMEGPSLRLLAVVSVKSPLSDKVQLTLLHPGHCLCGTSFLSLLWWWCRHGGSESPVGSMPSGLVLPAQPFCASHVENPTPLRFRDSRRVRTYCSVLLVVL